MDTASEVTVSARAAKRIAEILKGEPQATMLRVAVTDKVVIAPYTVLGWHVDDAAATAKALQQAGVKFERYPGMQQDELGIWNAPSGAKVAWFKDPDGNTLSISQI